MANADNARNPKAIFSHHREHREKTIFCLLCVFCGLSISCFLLLLFNSKALNHRSVAVQQCFKYKTALFPRQYNSAFLM